MLDVIQESHVIWNSSLFRRTFEGEYRKKYQVLKQGFLNSFPVVSFVFFPHETQRKANKGEESDIEENEELQVDLENFLIVDSVGDVNGGEFSFNEESEETPAETTKPVEVSRNEINVGNEHVKKIEVFYCELCRYYLPHLEDPEAALQKHCSTRNHLRAYLRYKENQSLKHTAELIHRRDHKEKHPKKDCKHSFFYRKLMNWRKNNWI